MKKIVIFIPSFDIGGVERVMILLANYLWLAEYQVTVIVAKDGGELKILLNSNINICSLGNIKLREALKPLIRCLNLIEPDYVICGPNFVNIITIIANSFRKNKAKVIISQHCFFDIETKRLGLHGKLIPWGIKFFYPRAYRIVAVSDGIKEMLLNYGLADSKIVSIYNPVDIQAIGRSALERNNLKLPEDYIVYIGRLSFVKNLPLLLRAFVVLRKRKSVSLVVVGEGAEKEQLVSMSHKLGIGKEVIFCGGLSNPFPVLAKARLLVLPSFSESFGNVIIEAMALGVTSVSTPTSGVREISEDGKLVYLSDSYSDETGFAQLLDFAYEHPIDASSLYQKSLEFDTNKIINLYQNLLK